MTRSSRFTILLTASILAMFVGISMAKAQVTCERSDYAVGGVICSAPVYPNRGASPRAYSQPRISPQEWAEQRRQAKVNAAYSKGAGAFNRKDWRAAVKYFEQALKLQPGNTHLSAWLGHTDNQWAVDVYEKGDWAAAIELFRRAVDVTPDTDPDKQTMRNNLALAQQKLDARRLEQQQAVNRQREDAAAAEAMRSALSRMVDSVPSAKGSGAVSASGDSGSSGGLTFMGPGSSSTITPARGSASNASTGSSGGLNFMGPEASNTFGVKSNPSNPDLGPAPAKSSATVTSALEQASSIAKSSNEAARARSIEEAKRLSGCGIDTGPCAQPDHIQPHPAQTPETAALLTHIPEAARQDKRIQESVAWYQKYERDALETAGKLAEVQRQIDSGKGDPAILNAQKGTLTNQLNDQKKLQKMEEDEIKKQLVTYNLPWREKPPQSESKTTGKP